MLLLLRTFRFPIVVIILEYFRVSFSYACYTQTLRTFQPLTPQKTYTQEKDNPTNWYRNAIEIRQNKLHEPLRSDGLLKRGEIRGKRRTNVGRFTPR